MVIKVVVVSFIGKMLTSMVSNSVNTEGYYFSDKEIVVYVRVYWLLVLG